jgi:hypothetical protein
MSTTDYALAVAIAVISLFVLTAVLSAWLRLANPRHLR